MTDTLKQRLTAEMKATMKSGDKPRLGTIRLALAAINQREIDERIELDDTQVLAVLDKMVKQRRDSLSQYEDAGREDLAAQERYEIEVLQDYLPQPLSDEEVQSLVQATIDELGAGSMKDMGRVMGALKPKLQGRADMGQVSGLVRGLLGA